MSRTILWLTICILGLVWPAGLHAETSSAAPDTVEALEPDVAPRLVQFIEAEYPVAALRAGREGAVLLELFVNAAGRVDSVRVLESVDPALDAAAAAAASRFVFTPAQADGAPVPVYVQYRYEFSLREQARRIDARVNFHGRVRERGTEKPVVDAVVTVACPDADSDSTLALPWSVWRERIGRFDGQYGEGENLVALTDSTGGFAFQGLPPGRLVVAIVAPGYHRFETTEQMGVDEALAADYWTTRESYSQYEMVVYGRAEEKEVTRQHLSVTEVERLPGFGGDVIKSVQALPGVARPGMTNPGAVIVRGSSDYDSRYILDGVDIPLLFHYGGVKSTYNSLALGSVDLYPGGYSVRYGGCVGGVIELRGRPAREDRWRTVLDASLLDASFHTEGSLRHGLGLLVTGRRSFAGEITKAAMKAQDDMQMTMAPYYADFVARLDYRPNAADRLFLTTFLVKDHMELVFPEQDEGSPEVNAATDEVNMNLAFSRYVVGHDWQVAPKLHNELRASYGRTTQDGHAFGYLTFRISGPMYQLRDELSYRAHRRATLNVGVDLASLPLDYYVRAAGWPGSSKTISYTDLGYYGSVDLRPREDLTITPGFRYDHYRHLHKGKAGLRLNARYAPSDAHTLTASVGSYNQPPQPVGQSTDPVYGNPDLPPTVATHVTFGDEWRLRDGVSLKTEIYYNTQKKIPALTDSANLNFLPDARGRMYGAEVMLRKDVGERFFGWLSYCLARSERRYARRPAFDDHGDAAGFPAASEEWDADRWWRYGYDQTHHFEAVGSWVLGRNWSTGFRAQYVTGNPVTPILNYTSNRLEFDADTGDYLPVAGEYLSDRMDPYFRLDFRADKKFVRKSTIWSVYLDVQNLNYFVYNSPEGYIYNYDYSKRDKYGWIILPAIGCRVEF